MSLSQIFFPLHIATLIFVGWNVLAADHMGFSWMSGKISLLNEAEVQKYHKRVSIGLGLMIATGLTLFWPSREFLLGRPQFYVKMAFIVALIINSFVINKLSRIPTTKTYQSLSFTEKLPMIISGGVSTLCWLGAIAGGFYLF